MLTDKDKILRFRIWQAKLVIAFEHFWQASFPAVMIAGVTLLVIVSGAIFYLPQYARLAVLLIALLVFLWALRPLLKSAWPGDAEAIRRIETRTGFKHRPLTSKYDHMAGDQGNFAAKAIWRAHQRAEVKRLKQLKTGLPRSDWMYRDPNALRFTLALFLIAAFFLQKDNWRQNLASAIAGDMPTISAAATIDAWISPPAFTARPPLLLTSQITRERLARGEALLVPENSSLIVRVNNADKPVITFSAPMDDGSDGKIFKQIKLDGKPGLKVHEGRTRLLRPAQINVSDGSNILGSWRVELIPDSRPELIIADKIKPTPTGGFSLGWKVSDDYGVAGINGTLKLAKPEASAEKPLEFKPPKVSISLPSLNPKKASGKAFHDFTDHPWAGHAVEMTLVARDQQGQESLPQTIRFRLPERRFTKPLVVAIIEQRKRLVSTPSKQRQISKMLAALMAWPQGLFKKSGHYLSLRNAVSRLYSADDRDRLKQSVADLWTIALMVEDGNVSAAMKKLEAARKELQKALQEGASPEKISELMAKLKQALDEYMAAMQKQMQEAAKSGKSPDGLNQTGRQISPRDLQKMLDNIEDLARNGSRDAAQEMLSQLEGILKNLQAGNSRQMQPQRNTPEAKALQELLDLMKKQQDLMDQTQTMPDEKQQQQGMQGKQGQRPDQKSQGNKQGNRLAEQQSRLDKMLGKLMQQMKNRGAGKQKALEQARRSMKGAVRSLKKGQKGRATGQQGNALDGMRQGAKGMARNLANKGVGNEGNFGKHGEAGNERTDPLGRPMPNSASDYGPREDILPKQGAIQRARDIMNLLRNRANQPQRPKIELDYLDRLLRGLY